MTDQEQNQLRQSEQLQHNDQTTSVAPISSQRIEIDPKYLPLVQKRKKGENINNAYIASMIGNNINYIIKKLEKDGIKVYDCFKRTNAEFGSKYKANKDFQQKIQYMLKPTKPPMKAFQTASVYNLQQQVIAQTALNQDVVAYLQTLNNSENNQKIQEVTAMLYHNLCLFPETKRYPNHESQMVEMNENSVVFDSRFESGNLHQAYKVSENEYNLLIDFDIINDQYSQWFLFAAKNVKKDLKVKFNIINLIKDNSEYTLETQPVIFSEAKYNHHKQGWHRNCQDITYSKSPYIKLQANSFQNLITPETAAQMNSPIKSASSFYKLSFSYTFHEAYDTVYFSQSFPYTYTDLQKYLEKMQKSRRSSGIVELTSLGKTPIGNDIFCLTITENIKSKEVVQHGSKEGIVITSRIHPGESPASYVIKGIMDLLTSEHKFAQKLRELFIFKIIPMLNPDGVRYGMYRSSLFGQDLNRLWKEPDKILSSPLLLVKQMIQKFQQDMKVLLFCDMHAHYKESDVFIYGCKTLAQQNQNLVPEQQEKEINQQVQIFPYLISKMNDIFSFEKCSFNQNKEKLGTARLVSFGEFNIPFSYTLESSILGSAKFLKENPSVVTLNHKCHLLKQQDYEQIGYDFLLALLLLKKETVMEDVKYLFSNNKPKLADMFSAQLKKIKQQHPINFEQCSNLPQYNLNGVAKHTLQQRFKLKKYTQFLKMLKKDQMSTGLLERPPTIDRIQSKLFKRKVNKKMTLQINDLHYEPLRIKDRAKTYVVPVTSSLGRTQIKCINATEISSEQLDRASTTQKMRTSMDNFRETQKEFSSAEIVTKKVQTRGFKNVNGKQRKKVTVLIEENKESQQQQNQQQQQQQQQQNSKVIQGDEGLLRQNKNENLQQNQVNTNSNVHLKMNIFSVDIDKLQLQHQNHSLSPLPMASLPKNTQTLSNLQQGGKYSKYNVKNFCKQLSSANSLVINVINSARASISHAVKQQNSSDKDNDQSLQITSQRNLLIEHQNNGVEKYSQKCQTSPNQDKAQNIVDDLRNKQQVKSNYRIQKGSSKLFFNSQQNQNQNQQQYQISNNIIQKVSQKEAQIITYSYANQHKNINENIANKNMMLHGQVMPTYQKSLPNKQQIHNSDQINPQFEDHFIVQQQQAELDAKQKAQREKVELHILYQKQHKLLQISKSNKSLIHHSQSKQFLKNDPFEGLQAHSYLQTNEGSSPENKSHSKIKQLKDLVGTKTFQSINDAHCYLSIGPYQHKGTSNAK